MNPTVFVVDTNVVIAGLVTGNSTSPVALVLEAMLSGRLIYMLSPALLDEYRRVLLRPRLARLHGLNEQEVDRLLVELTANAVWHEPGPAGPAPGRDDDHLWALLETNPGSILITGDRLLLDHPPVDSQAISPRSWIDRFAATGP